MSGEREWQIFEKIRDLYEEIQPTSRPFFFSGFFLLPKTVQGKNT
jgi:hypothetical protein